MSAVGKARTLLAAATSGSWEWDSRSGNMWTQWGVDVGEEVVFSTLDWADPQPPSDADAELIAQAPTLLSALAEEVEQLRETLSWFVGNPWHNGAIDRDTYAEDLYCPVNHGLDDTCWQDLARYARTRKLLGLETHKEQASIKYIRDMLFRRCLRTRFAEWVSARAGL